MASSTFDTAIRAIANGGNAVMVGGLVTKYPYSIMTVPNITTAADMKGKRIILPFPKDLLTIVWNRWLTEKGMRPDDVEQVYAGATPNRLAALVSGTVQAALLTQPFDFRAAADGYQQAARHRRLRQGIRLPHRAGAAAMAARQSGHGARLSARAVGRRRLAVRPGQPRRGDRDPRARPPSSTRRSRRRPTTITSSELQPFSRKLAIPAEIVPTTVKTLIELGDIKPDSTGKTYADLSYLPR